MVEQINTEELKSYEHGDAVFEARPLTIEEARSMQRPSSKLFCRLQDNEHITFGHYSIRDYDSGTVLLDIGEEMQDYAHLKAVAEENEGCTSLQSRTIKYPFGPQFLELKNLALKLEFNVVGEEPVKDLLLIERHYYKEKLVRNFEFKFPFCMPKSKNQCEFVYDMPVLSEEEK